MSGISCLLLYLSKSLTYLFQYECIFLLSDGSCNTHKDCEVNSYCDANKCLSPCNNSLDCPNGVCTSLSVVDKDVKVCKDQCNETSLDYCAKTEICVGKPNFFVIFYSHLDLECLIN